MDEDTRNLVDDYKGLDVEVIQARMAEGAYEYHIAIENLQHDFNIGSIVRSANAFNAGGVHIIGKRHWNKRGAMATEKYLTLYHHATVHEFVAWCKLNVLRIIGIDNVEGSVELHNAELPKQCVLVFGQEGPGLSAELARECEYLVAIEQFGSTRSVNVGAAAAIVMYEWVRRHILADN
jgi:tRNA G18 (ribose-2'-O)-methylase SpoU